MFDVRFSFSQDHGIGTVYDEKCDSVQNFRILNSDE